MRELTREVADRDIGHFDGRARPINCPAHVDSRGTLCALEFDRLPFVPKRAFAVSGVPAGCTRGGHAHRTCRQFLICVQGRIEVLMRCQGTEGSVILEAGRAGLLVEPGVWCQQKYLTKDSVLLVFASEPYHPLSYVATWT